MLTCLITMLLAASVLQFNTAEPNLIEYTSSANDDRYFNNRITDPPLGQDHRINNFLQGLALNKANLIRPGLGGSPIVITTSIILTSINNLSDEDMTYELDFYLIEEWKDDRLRYGRDVSNRESMGVPYQSSSDIWVPDTYLVNADKTAKIDFYSMSHKYGLRLSHNGKLVYSRRISATLSCSMDLAMYPFDLQKCLLTISSYIYNYKVLRYQWMHSDRNEALGIEPGYQMPYFNLKHVTHYERNLTYRGDVYPALEVCFLFRRNTGYCYMQLIIPAAAVVLSSWIALWLENDAQISDLLTTLLAILFLSYSYNDVMPRVSYVKAMDVYLMACFMFIFLSLAKLILVKRFKARVAKNENAQAELFDDEDIKLIMNGIAGSEDEARQKHAKEVRKKEKRFHMLEIGTQLILPILFVTFCIFFFLIYPATIKMPHCPPTDDYWH